MPLSMLVFGPVADRLSVQAVMILTGIILTVAVLGILAIQLARRSLHTTASLPARPGALGSGSWSA